MRKKNKKEEKSIGFGIAGFILSLLGLILFFIFFIAPIFSILGIIFSLIQIKRKKTGLAIAGLIIGIFALLIDIAFIFFLIFAVREILSLAAFANSSTPSFAIISPPFSVLSTNVSEDEISLSIINNGKERVSVQRVAIEGCGSSNPEKELGPNQGLEIMVPCQLNKNEITSMKIEIQYRKEGSSAQLTSQGQIAIFRK